MAYLNGRKIFFSTNTFQSGGNIPMTEDGGFIISSDPVNANAHSPSAVSCGNGTTAGQKAFKIVNFDTGDQWYMLDSVDGLEVGMRVSIQLTRCYDDCGTITDIYHNEGQHYVKVSNFCYTAGEDSVQENSSLRAIDYPELGTFSFGDGALASGNETKALGFGSFASGFQTEAIGKYSVAVGNSTKAGFAAVSEGRDTVASGRMSHAMGDANTASGACSFAGGYDSTASGDGSIALGKSTEASAFYSTAIGDGTRSIKAYAIAVGKDTTASGENSVASGKNTIASAIGAFAHGVNSKATGNYSTAIGQNITSTGHWSFSAPYSKHSVEEFIDPNASNNDILAVYKNCEPFEKFSLAKGSQSVALGRECVALGAGSVVLGYENISTNWGSATIGRGLISTSGEATVVGRFNKNDPTNVFEVGIGSSDNDRRNGFWIKADGTTSLHKVIDDKITAAGIGGGSGSSGMGELNCWNGSLDSLEPGVYSVIDGASFEFYDGNRELTYTSIGNGSIVIVGRRMDWNSDTGYSNFATVLAPDGFRYLG